MPHTRSDDTWSIAATISYPPQNTDRKMELHTFEELRNENTALKLRNSSLQNSLDETKALLEAERKALKNIQLSAAVSHRELGAIKAFCNDDEAFKSFIQVRYNLHHLNDIIASISKCFLRDILYRTPEVFQEQLDCAYKHCRESIGKTLCDTLVKQSTTAIAGLERGRLAPNAVLVQAVLQIFLTNICVLDLNPHSACVLGIEDDLYGDYLHVSRQHHVLEPSPAPLPLQVFKSNLLRKFSAVLQTAAWILHGDVRRAHFEDLIPSLFDAKEALRQSLSEAYPSTGLEISIVRETQLVEYFMDAVHDQSAVEHTSESLSRCAVDEGQAVVGTVALGLKKVMQPRPGEGSSQSSLKSICRVQVILESTIRNAITFATTA